MSLSCRVCSNSDLIEVINLGKLPIAHRLVLNPEDEEFVHPLALHSCPNCGFVQICEPIDPALLYLDYNYCFSSWKPQPHVADEVDTIFAYTEGNSVLEIGCNDGLFLDALRLKGASLVVGVEPNPYASKIAREKGFEVYSKMLNPEICQGIVEKSGKFETVVARQVLEHLQDISGFFECADILLKEDGFLFIDIPDFETGLSMGDCSVIWEEHINYFTEGTLSATLQRFGYQPIAVQRYNFSGGTAAILAKRMPGGSNNTITVNPLEKLLCEFSSKVHAYGEELRIVLKSYREKGFKVVLYGVGCRACTAVNGLNLGGCIDFAIDDQAERQNKYMPGSKLKILPSQVMEEYSDRVLCLLAVNQENEAKVQAKLRSISKAHIEFVSLFSPNDIWSELDRIKHN